MRLARKLTFCTHIVVEAASRRSRQLPQEVGVRGGVDGGGKVKQCMKI